MSKDESSKDAADHAQDLANKIDELISQFNANHPHSPIEEIKSLKVTACGNPHVIITLEYNT